MADDPKISEKLNAFFEGRYVLSRELGRGGMATVYLAMDVKHEREVAIKVLHPELSATIGGDRFEREIKVAAKLQHPNILGMYDSGSAEGLLYYVMPFVTGESLRDRIDREGMLPIDEAIGIALEVNGALGHAHAKGVVHRDIKPENILLQDGHALVADFGIARAIEDGGQKLTQTGMSMGTPHYMPPEQSSGEVVGPSADLYALGCVLYEMLAGEPPFTGKNAMQIMARHAMEQVPSIRIVRPSVPEDIEHAIFVTLNKAPADRPQNAEQFAQLLGVVLGQTASMRVFTATMARRTPTPMTGTMAIPEGFTNPTLIQLPVPWWKRPAAMITLGLVIAGAAFGVWRFKSGGRGPSAFSGPEARRIAVLYFTDASKDTSLGPVVDGLTEGLNRSLSTATSFSVISLQGVEKFRHSDIAPDSIARALRVGYLVRGDVEKDGDKLTVSVRLDDASGVNLSKKSLSGAANNVAKLRDSLVVVASDLIRQQLGQDVQLKESRGATNNDAWLLLQRGAAAQRNGEEANAKGDAAGFTAAFNAADSLFDLAGRADPSWPDPPTRRAQLAYRRARVLGAPDSVRKWTSIGIPYADAAIKLDPNDADAYEARGRLTYFPLVLSLETDEVRRKAALDRARADLEKATSINSKQAAAWAELSHLYYQMPDLGPSDIAIAAQNALSADEFLSNANIIYQRLFLVQYDMGQFDKAKQYCEQAGARFPKDVRVVRCQLYLLTTKATEPNVAAAWKLADSAVKMVPAGAQVAERRTENMLVAAVLARASKNQPALADSARNVFKAAAALDAPDATREVGLFGSFVYTLLGDAENAVRQLKDHLAANPAKVEGLRRDAGWWYRPIENDPRFKAAIGGR